MGLCCGKRGKQEKSKTNPFDKIQNQTLAQASSPSNLPTNDITMVYDLPSEEFQTEEDVIKSHGFEINEEINSGAFAKVYRARRLRDNFPLAAKIMILSKGLRQNPSMLNMDAKFELFVMQKTSHPHIIKVYDHFFVKTPDSKSCYIFMQLAVDSLSNVLRVHKEPYHESVAKRKFAQMVSAVDHMHRQNIAHRDIKMGNILLDKEHNVLIADFGLSRVAYRLSKGGTVMSNAFCGTIPYMAPEVLVNHNKEHNVRTYYNPFLADIWALGIILFCMINRAYPFSDLEKGKDDMIHKQLKGKYQFRSNINPSKELRDIIKRLLEGNDRKRITMSELMDHIWIRDEIKIISAKMIS